MLLTAVLVLTLMALATPALLFVGAEAAQLGRARMDHLRARLAARSAVQAGLAAWRTAALDSLAPGEAVRLADGQLGGGVSYHALAERVGPGWYLIRGQGRVGPPDDLRGRAAVGHLVVAAELEAIVEALLSAPAEAADPLAIPGFPFSDLLPALADGRPTGEVRPRPVTRGHECEASPPENWGEPDHPGHPCGGYFPLLHAPASVTVLEGRGQGILVVDGDLTLGPEARFHGLVLVAGRLTLAPGAAVIGLARFGAGAAAGEGVIRDAGVLRVALRGCSAFNRPFPPPGRRWIPLF